MKKTSIAVLISTFTFLTFLFAGKSEATTFNVTVQNIVFTPSSISVTVGDTVKWTWINGSHTTTCNGTSLTSRPSGAASWSANINSSTPTFSYVVTVAGTYNYKCNPHGTSGMVGVINAAPALVKLNLTALIEGFWDGSTMISDTVRVYLRNSVSPFATVDSAKVKLSTLGNGLYTFNNAVSGNYYIVVSHRNSIVTWSNTSQSFTAGVTKVYNFTTAQTQAFGNNMILKSGKFVIYGGDVTRDETIDAGDISIVDNDVSNAASGYIISDLNGDDFADGTDLSIVENNAGNSISVISP